MQVPPLQQGECIEIPHYVIRELAFHDYPNILFLTVRYLSLWETQLLNCTMFMEADLTTLTDSNYTQGEAQTTPTSGIE